MNPENFISFDIETNGPCPSIHSMLSLGAALFTGTDETAKETFYAKLEPLPWTIEDVETMKWWAKFPVEYAETKKDAKSASVVIPAFAKWLTDIKDKHGPYVLYAAPSGFDFSFLYYYFHRFLGTSPVKRTCMDGNSYAAGLTRSPMRGIPLRKLIGKVSYGTRHNAVDDAIRQGIKLMKLRQALLTDRSTW